jgi:mannose-6-phosphate isomerase
MEERKLTPLKFLPDVREFPWGRAEYRLADLGFIDSMASEGWLGGNTLSDIMQTYLERVVGETSFDWYGTQFPLLVKRLDVKGRTSLHVNPDDECAEQRYDAFGKTALWYVEACGPDARLYLGWKRDISAAAFYQACQDGTVEELLYSVQPVPGESYLVLPGQVHAAQDVKLLEIAECSELGFRLYDWDSQERENHLEEAFDIIDFKAYRPADSGEGALLAATPQFTVHRIQLRETLRSQAAPEDSFLVYICTAGQAILKVKEDSYTLKAGELVLVPSEVNDFFLLPAAADTTLLEVRLDPRPSEDIVSDPVEEE